MKRRAPWFVLAVLTVFPPMAVASPTTPEISVANYQVEPTSADAEMLPVFEKQFGARFRVLNFDNLHYHEQLNAKLGAGEIPDFLYLRTATTLVSYQKLGFLAPIPDDLLAQEAPRLVRALKDNAPGYLEMGRIGGVQYGIPVVNLKNRYHIPLVYRQDWMARLGVSKAPETLGEFEDLMRRFARNDPDGDGKKDTWGLSRDGLDAVFGAFGLVPFDEKTDYWIEENGRVLNSALSSKAPQALALLARWYKEGLIDPEFITGENKGGYWALSQAFLEGRIGFTTHGNYYHWTTAGVFPGAEAFGNGKELSVRQPGARLTFGGALAGPSGVRGIKEFNGLMNFITVGRNAPRTPGKLGILLKILDANASDDPLQRLSLHYGVEGRHWKLVDRTTGALKILPPWNQDDGYWSRIGCVLSFDVPSPETAPPEQWAHSLGYDRDGIRSLVQVGLPTMDRYGETLRRLRIEAYIAFITGARPLSGFGNFVAQYRAAGGNEVEAEVNRYLGTTR